MPHFHIPLQNGSDEVLRLMRRRYDTALFRSKIEHIRRVMPDAFIGVDLIVGARGETEELFEESKAGNSPCRQSGREAPAHSSDARRL